MIVDRKHAATDSPLVIANRIIETLGGIRIASTDEQATREMAWLRG